MILGDWDCKQQNQICDLSADILKLRNQCASKDTEIRQIKKQNSLLKNNLQSLRSGKLPKTITNKIVHNQLSGKFTGAQIRQILKPIKVPVPSP